MDPMFAPSQRKPGFTTAVAAGVGAWLLAGACVGAFAGGLAVRANLSLQGEGQAGPFLLWALAVYALGFALVGVVVSLAVRGAASGKHAFDASFVAALLGFAAFSASQWAIASFTWRDDTNGLNLTLSGVSALCVALLARRLLARGAFEYVAWPLVGLSLLVSAAVALSSLGAGRIERHVPPPKLEVARDAGGALPRVMVIGIDGLDWARLGPLMTAGRLPNFAKLCDGGYTAPLATRRPTWSPIAWNTIATGVDEQTHGITDFTEVALPGLERGVERSYPKLREPALLPRALGLAALFELAVARSWVPELAVSGLHRRSKAFWNVLGEQGVGVGVIRWWATWPAEQVNGWFVSDNDPLMQVLASSKSHSGTVNATPAHYCWPSELGAELLPLLAARKPPDYDVLAHPILAEFTDEDRATLAGEPMTRLWFDVIARGDRFAADCGLNLWREKKAPMVAVYLRAVDNLSHRMWSYTGVVDEAYAYTDVLLGELVAAAGSDATVVIVSDHGWNYDTVLDEASGRRAPGPLFGHNHAPPGVMILKGRDVVAGAPAREAQEPSILDVAPTILALYGLPPSAEMPGRAWREAFRAGSPAALERERVPTYGTYRQRWGSGAGTRASQAGRAEAVELLRHLGYLD